jgi:twitching motility protein PilT
MADLDGLLKVVTEQRGSDLHLTTGACPLLRLHGDLRPVNGSAPLDAEATRRLIEQAMSPTQRERWAARHDVDFAYEVPGLGRFRVNAFFQRQGPGAVFRNIPFEIQSVEALGLPTHILKLADHRKGLVLVTGSTGSGKSTTLAALVDHINRTRHEHIITVEDPIEFVHANQGCLVNQREVGPHTESFAVALRAALREDPDVILVGELRDLETIELALTAAETGHLVLGTLHTNSAADSIDRIINVFPVNEQELIRQIVSNVLVGVISQNLLRRADRPGRILAAEIMLVNSAIANLIREGKTFQILSAMQSALREGSQTMDKALETLVLERKVAAEEARKYARGKDAFGAAGGDWQGGFVAPPRP